jgi:hypothetical protein
MGQTFLSFQVCFQASTVQKPLIRVLPPFAQWDILLFEASFLCVLLGNVGWSFLPSIPKQPSRTVLWLMRFLLFRLMFASGVVKLQSGDATWWKLTALEVHYSSQCIPTPLAWYAHQLPPLVHKLSVALCLWIEIPAAFLILLPSRFYRRLAAATQVLLQLIIAATGNYTL